VPPSAEHAFEELLVALVDDSPQEREAWRIAGEQEARGAFESEETIRHLDELAAYGGLAYDCASRTYRPVSGGPNPAEIEEAKEEEEEESSELAEGRGDQPAQPDHRPSPSPAVGPGVPAGPGAPVPEGQGPRHRPPRGRVRPARPRRPHQPGAATVTTGRLRPRSAREPWNGRSEKLKIPPSAATMR